VGEGMLVTKRAVCVVISIPLTQPRRHLFLGLPSPAFLASLAAALALLV
jgi:hypothetical protein